MKNRLLLILGFVTIGLVATGGALSVSAKEKPDVVILVSAESQFDLFVSRETAYLVNHLAFVDQKTLNVSSGGTAIHSDALLPVEFSLHRVSHYSDRYLQRSQKWIRDRNLRMSGLLNSFDTNKSFKTQFLS